MSRFTVVLLFPLALCLSACSGANAKHAGGESPGKPVAAVSILPQTFFAERIAAGRFLVSVLVGPGQNPHSYEPTPGQMAELSRAAMWILSGTEFEIGLRPKIAALFPALPIIDGTRGVRFRTLEGEEHEGGIDRHSWLGREPAKIMAVRIRDALSAADPEGAAVYKENCAALTAEIDGEFEALKAKLGPLRGRLVFVYHPAFGYFLDEFGLIQEAVETGGREPTPRELERLMEKARQEGAAAIFFQTQFPAGTVKTVADAMGIKPAALDPLSPDWLANIRVMGNALAGAIE
jgi:zinc transport system substrate-binding protein